MRRSYFVPLLVLGGILVVAGLLGVRAAKIAPEQDRQLTKWSLDGFRQNVDDGARERAVRSLREEIAALRQQHIWLHALWAIFVGLVFVIWGLFSIGRFFTYGYEKRGRESLYRL